MSRSEDEKMSRTVTHKARKKSPHIKISYDLRSVKGRIRRPSVDSVSDLSCDESINVTDVSHDYEYTDEFGETTLTASSANDTRSESSPGDDQPDGIRKRRKKSKKLDASPMTEKNTSPKPAIFSSAGKSKDYSYVTNIVLPTIVFILILIYVINFWMKFDVYGITPGVPTSKEERIKLFDESVSSLKEKFPLQTDRFWRVLKASIKANFRSDEPIYPAIVLMAANDTGMRTSECIIKEIVKISGEAFLSNHVLEMNAEEFKSMSEDSAKYKLDNKYKEHFKSGHKISVLYNLEQTPAEIGMLLHAYCDNENAPYKKGLFIFSVSLGSINYNEITENLIENSLAKSWQNLGQDQYEAIWSRIGNNVAIVKQDQTC